MFRKWNYLGKPAITLCYSLGEFKYIWWWNWINGLAGNISKLKIKNSEELGFGEEACYVIMLGQTNSLRLLQKMK